MASTLRYSQFLSTKNQVTASVYIYRDRYQIYIYIYIYKSQRKGIVSVSPKSNLSGIVSFSLFILDHLVATQHIHRSTYRSIYLHFWLRHCYAQKRGFQLVFSSYSNNPPQSFISSLRSNIFRYTEVYHVYRYTKTTRHLDHLIQSANTRIVIDKSLSHELDCDRQKTLNS